VTDPERGIRRGFDFIELNQRTPKPRTNRGVTEIRGTHYKPLGPRALEDTLEAMGEYIDTLKFAGGSFAIMPRAVSAKIIEICHAYDVKVSTGGALEHALMRRGDVVDKFLAEVIDLGFDTVEVSANYISLPQDDLVRLCEKVVKLGLAAKPEIALRSGTAGGVVNAADIESNDVADVAYMIQLGKRYLDAGAHMLMVESEGITEDVTTWRPDVVSRLVDGLGLEHLMFEAADPVVFAWYIRLYGAEVNLFIDHSQIYHLESLRSGVGGGGPLWGRVLTYNPDAG
jgi:phosphosulfolactate synthase (CoM biosynthesis protein A)